MYCSRSSAASLPPASLSIWANIGRYFRAYFPAPFGIFAILGRIYMSSMHKSVVILHPCGDHHSKSDDKSNYKADETQG